MPFVATPNTLSKAKFIQMNGDENTELAAIRILFRQLGDNRLKSPTALAWTWLPVL